MSITYSISIHNIIPKPFNLIHWKEECVLGPAYAEIFYPVQNLYFLTPSKTSRRLISPVSDRYVSFRVVYSANFLNIGS